MFSSNYKTNYLNCAWQWQTLSNYSLPSTQLILRDEQDIEHTGICVEMYFYKTKILFSLWVLGERRCETV